MMGFVWVEESFLTMTSDRQNYWVNFYAIHIQHFMSDSNSKINNL